MFLSKLSEICSIVVLLYIYTSLCVLLCVCDMDKLKLVNSPCFTRIKQKMFRLKEENEKMFGRKVLSM